MSVKDIIMGAAGAASSGGYEIQRSLRFNSADSAFLNRTPASAGNQTTWTFSFWMKRSALGVESEILNCVNSAISRSAYLRWNSDNTLTYFDYNSSGGTFINRITTTQVFRDTSAWYHITFTYDTGNATESERLRLYVNGVRVSALSIASYPSLNYAGVINTTNSTTIGRFSFSASGFFSGYMTEVNFIDGQALTPSSFGAFDAQTGVWGPTRYAGSYGTNGFYLNFSDNSNTTAATLGKDYSGNGNNWTPNNFSVSAGAGNDSLVDVPTNWGTDTGVGGSVRGNYCTFNPLYTGNTLTLANGNLDASRVNASTSQYYTAGSTISVASGKWYWEINISAISGAAGQWAQLGVVRSDQLLINSYLGSGSLVGYSYFNDGVKAHNGSLSSYAATFTSGDIIGVAFDADAGTITFYKNGVSQGQAFSGISMSIPWSPAVQLYDAATITQRLIANFGQRPFAYTAPSGFRALNTQNLPTPTIGATTATQAGKYYNAVLWTGNGSVPRAITGLGFQPDFVWGKARSIGFSNILYDSVRGTGTTKSLISNSTDAEGTASSFANISSFDSDGFTVGVTGSTNVLNDNGYTFVGWGWRASNAAAVTNTAGSITSTVSANTTSGFSVVTYTGNGTAGATVGHGLGRNVALYFVKNRSASANWAVLGHALNTANGGNKSFLLLNTTNAIGSAAQGPGNSSTIELWNDSTNNASGNNYVAYCFAEVPGYSRFGSYTGNGSTDGPFVFCGFRPAYILIKRSSASGTDWNIYDTTRIPSNVSDDMLFANLSNAELANEPSLAIDILSNGFKVRTTGSSINDNGGTMIFAAFASAPQKFALAR